MEGRTVDDGVEIAVHAWGDGPPVVLQHGFAANSQLNWELPGVVKVLVDRGHRVIAVDARGHGASDHPHDPALYGEARMAKDLLQVTESLEPFALVGYSMGAVVALLAATTEPGRIARLVVGGVGEGILECGGVDTRALPNGALVNALRADDPATIEFPEVAAFRAFADAVGADRLALAAQAEVVHAQPIPLERITAPTLVLAGDDDPLAKNPERLAAAIPGARWEKHPGDHLAVVGVPSFQQALADFLDA